MRIKWSQKTIRRRRWDMAIGVLMLVAFAALQAWALMAAAAGNTREYAQRASRPMMASECDGRITVNHEQRGAVPPWKVFCYYGGRMRWRRAR